MSTRSERVDDRNRKLVQPMGIFYEEKQGLFSRGGVEQVLDREGCFERESVGIRTLLDSFWI